MPQNANVTLPANVWTLITPNDVTDVTFMNTSMYDIWIMGTVGAVAPTVNGPAGLRYTSMTGEAKQPVADLFLGVSGVNRLYAFCKEAGEVFVSHA